MQVHHAGGKKDEDAGETLAPFSFSFLLLLLLLPCIVHVSMSHPGRQASSDDCISLLSRGASPASCLLMPRSWKAVAARMRGRGLGLRLVCWWWRRRPTPSNSRACGLSLTWRSVLRLRAGTSSSWPTASAQPTGEGGGPTERPAKPSPQRLPLLYQSRPVLISADLRTLTQKPSSSLWAE